MLKFFQFSGTISGTTYFLRILFTLLLSIPGLIVFVSLISSYMIGEGIIDVNNPESFDQSAIEKIEENPDEFLSLVLCFNRMVIFYFVSIFTSYLV